MSFTRQKSAVFSALGFPPDFSGLSAIASLRPANRSKLLTWMDRGNLSLYFLDQLNRHAAQDRLPPEFLDALNERLAQNRLRTEEWLRDFRAISAALAQSDIPHVALKGFTLVPEFCPRFELRHQGDIDLLIQPADADRAQSVLAALRRRRGHAPQTRVSQRHGVDVDVSGFLRGARARVGFFAGSNCGGKKLSRQFGKNPERRLPRPDSRNPRRRRAAHATRLRRAGVGRDGKFARVEVIEFAKRAGKMSA